jgi:hypothetical protein
MFGSEILVITTVVSFVVFFLRIQYPRVSLFFTLSATANRVYALILHACKYILKARHASVRDLDLNHVSSLASGCTDVVSHSMHNLYRTHTGR